MQQTLQLRVRPSELADHEAILQRIAMASGHRIEIITGFYILKQSLDARGRTIWINLSVQAFFNEPFVQRPLQSFSFQDVQQAAHSVVIIGAGPAGLFAALQLIELGIRPILLERGKDVRSRRRDLALLNKSGIINPNSNYCFGEGGAGTYSDGKLYTRSNKRGDINRILNLFVHFGATEKILYEAHPHIGTNKLPHIITAMREQIEQCGGQIHFEQQVTDFDIQGTELKSVITARGDRFAASSFIIATGHSARDIFELFHHKQLLIEAKPFALGVRVEHPQTIIDSAQYHCDFRGAYLPPAAYSLVQQVHGRGVFSFCMCPGGIIAPAATAPNELVVNGWSPSKRNNPFANSGMVVEVRPEDALFTLKEGGWKEKADADSPLLMMHFQQYVEQRSYAAGGGAFRAPAQRMVNFSKGIASSTLPDCSYQPGLNSINLQEVLPAFAYEALAKGFEEFGRKMYGFFSNEAVVVATESRTSSPVRIPRDTEQLHHPQMVNCYPCAEGAGYAGGIVSAAMDGERVAHQIAQQLLR